MYVRGSNTDERSGAACNQPVGGSVVSVMHQVTRPLNHVRRFFCPAIQRYPIPASRRPLDRAGWVLGKFPTLRLVSARIRDKMQPFSAVFLDSLQTVGGYGQIRRVVTFTAQARDLVLASNLASTGFCFQRVLNTRLIMLATTPIASRLRDGFSEPMFDNGRTDTTAIRCECGNRPRLASSPAQGGAFPLSA